jgi:hypothetical protein
MVLVQTSSIHTRSVVPNKDPTLSANVENNKKQSIHIMCMYVHMYVYTYMLYVSVINIRNIYISHMLYVIHTYIYICVNIYIYIYIVSDFFFVVTVKTTDTLLIQSFAIQIYRNVVG